ncbi:MAG: DUF370 domain-containing protein [Oscillospiraceae bacterium]|nr:DUF370 domain-containing protein [Oscillospiraceae bacterium]
MKKRGGFLFLGGETTVRADEVVGVFDIEECSVSRITADYLNACQKRGDIANVSEDMPKSFVVTVDGTYISNVSAATINKRGSGAPTRTPPFGR